MDPQVNKFEQVSSLGHQMSLAGPGGPTQVPYPEGVAGGSHTVRYHVQGESYRGPHTVRSHVLGVGGGGVPVW